MDLPLLGELVDIACRDVSQATRREQAVMSINPLKILARPEGFEPPTPGLGIRCSILLSYGRRSRLAVN